MKNDTALVVFICNTTVELPVEIAAELVRENKAIYANGSPIERAVRRPPENRRSAPWQSGHTR